MTSKLAFAGFLLILGLAAWLTYDRIFVEKDYLIEYSVACDPYVSSCFALTCEEGDENCEVTYYATAIKRAKDLSIACGQTLLDECEAAAQCIPTDTHCEIQYCEEDCISLTATEEIENGTNVESSD